MRLIETKDTAPSGPYITISHCWGNGNMLQLERSKFNKFKTSIPNLPKTFDDLIIAAQKFGVKYVWIDCLCIIQDEISDWNSECSTMDKVYRNSFLNIAATASHDSHGGLFFDRPKFKPCTVKLSAGRGRETFLLVDPEHFQMDIADSPLLKVGKHLGLFMVLDPDLIIQRGWVLQERFLAPRVLHFARKQLFWECKELCASETYPYGLPSGVRRDDLRQVLKEREKDSATKRPPLSLLKFGSPSVGRSYEKIEGVEAIDEKEVKLWYRIVEVYSKTSLTFTSDKLPALSGISKFFQSSPTNTYLAGMWKAHLPVGLAWHRSGQAQETGLPRPEKYRAPTWSWMSTDHPVTIHKYSASPILRILDAQTSPTTVDPTGPVSGGFLVVEGTLTPLTWKRYWLHMDGEVMYKMSITLDDPRSDSQLDEEIEGFALPLLEYNYTVYQNVNFHYQNYPQSSIAFLFLQPVQNQPSHFVRIGMGTARETYSKEAKTLLAGKDIGNELGVKFLGNHRGYRLTIV
jgi:hypothetical protein